MASAYSINTTETGRRIRWARPAIELQVEPGLLGMLPGDEVLQALRIGVDAWQGLPGVPEISLAGARLATPGHHTGGPSNGVYLPATWEHDPNKLAITVVTYEMASGRLLDADVLVNPTVPFALLHEPLLSTPHALSEARDPTVGQARPLELGQPPVPANRYDLAAVLTHELGHVLGLGESEDDRFATMWPYANLGDTHQRTLSDDDEAGVVEAYGGPAPLPASTCAPMSVGGARSAPLWLAGLFGVLVCLALRRLHSGRATIAAGLSMLLAGGGVSTAHQSSADRVRELATRPWAEAQIELRAAVLDSDQSVRKAAAELLASHGEHAQLELSRRLSNDSSPLVAREGHAALARCAASLPQRIVSASDPLAAKRLARVLEAAGQTGFVGRVARAQARDDGGRISTEYLVQGSNGEQRILRVAGGEHAGVAQRYGDETLPIEGAEVLLGAREDRWAYHATTRGKAGTLRPVVWGGSLGDDAAIALR